MRFLGEPSRDQEIPYYKQIVFFLEIAQDYNIVSPKIETQKSSMYFRHASLSNSVDATDRICYNGERLVYINEGIFISAIDTKEVKP